MTLSQNALVAVTAEVFAGISVICAASGRWYVTGPFAAAALQLSIWWSIDVAIRTAGRQ